MKIGWKKLTKCSLIGCLRDDPSSPSSCNSVDQTAKGTASTSSTRRTSRRTASPRARGSPCWPTTARTGMQSCLLSLVGVRGRWVVQCDLITAMMFSHYLQNRHASASLRIQHEPSFCFSAQFHTNDFIMANLR